MLLVPHSLPGCFEGNLMPRAFELPRKPQPVLCAELTLVGPGGEVMGLQGRRSRGNFCQEAANRGQNPVIREFVYPVSRPV